MTIREFAPAKINLALHVTGQRADGFHLLDSLVCFADLGDWITVTKADDLSLTLSGPFSSMVPSGADNLVIRAARLIADGRGARITLEKNLPVASGIGGGSADAAAVLRALARLFKCPLPEQQSLVALGADIPVCLAGGVSRMSGIGEVISPVAEFSGLFGILVNPGVAVSTPLVFQALACKSNPDLGVLANSMKWRDYLLDQRNDLQAPAISLVPVVQEVLDRMQDQSGCYMARMSGSGATCFGLFENQEVARTGADEIANMHPDWWVKTVKLAA